MGGPRGVPRSRRRDRTRTGFPGAEPLRARRRRSRPRRGGRRRRSRVPHADGPPQRARVAPGRLRLGGRRADHLHVDAVRLGRSPPRRRASRHPARQGAGRVPLHGRRLRREERPRRRHLRRRRARASHGPAGPLRAHAPRGEPREREPQRVDPAPDRGGARRRDADRARRRVRHVRGLGRLRQLDGRADADALRLQERAYHRDRCEAQHRPQRRVSRASGSSRGRSGLREPARRARRQARARPARAAPP